MNVHSYRQGRTIKTVTIANVPSCNKENDEAVIALAMTHAGESKSSLFGWHLAYFDEDDLGMTAVVSLYTD